jgi:phosphoserine phosphatase
MVAITWQLQHPIDTIIFDCDGTLSTIEGIDELALSNGASETVRQLTEDAMSRSSMNLELYDRRLELVKPTRKATTELADHYFAHRTPDIEAIIRIFKRLKKNVYILSAGLLPSVSLFGEQLGIPKENIIAVDIQFNEQGNYQDFDRTSPLVTSTGKRIIVSQIKALHPELIFVGDGMNDIAALDLVDRFIGYGGAFYREKIAELSQFYITVPTLAPLLPLTLTLDEFNQLNADERMLYQKGLQAIQKNEVNID